MSIFTGFYSVSIMVLWVYPKRAPSFSQKGARFGYNLEIAKRGRVLGTGVELIKVTNVVINRYSGVLFLLK